MFQKIKQKAKIKAAAWWAKGLLLRGDNARKRLTGRYLGIKVKEMIKMGEKTETGSKKWWQSKTVWANGLTLLAGVLTSLASDKQLDPQTVGYAATVLGMVNIILRMITNKPIVSK